MSLRGENFPPSVYEFMRMLPVQFSVKREEYINKQNSER